MDIAERIAKAMTASKAWPAVFEAGSAQELARAALAAIDAAGYVVVPKKPTPEMIEAGWNASDDCRLNAPVGDGVPGTVGWSLEYDNKGPSAVASAYLAMMEARPK